ncbi:hypothetical protein XBKQ1_1780001 [Xenorhabdus bovienii str. kraussei Quebec]|uniref:Uncharacterized protein n=1 Tax=Xenorhabdus bovienii str. kraussei Quebec TaxID=1398203 RepID=A0A077PE85_XENBV|nr:hypothetical protein XBKQ1_1780001 [Xenorhabdus bovienii str. kraussei Quebec]
MVVFPGPNQDKVRIDSIHGLTDLPKNVFFSSFITPGNTIEPRQIQMTPPLARLYLKDTSSYSLKASFEELAKNVSFKFSNA